MLCLLPQAGKLLDLQYVDPYAAEVYTVQQKKWDLKQKPEATKGLYTASVASASTTPLSVQGAF